MLVSERVYIYIFIDIYIYIQSLTNNPGGYNTYHMLTSFSTRGGVPDAKLLTCCAVCCGRKLKWQHALKLLSEALEWHLVAGWLDTNWKIKTRWWQLKDVFIFIPNPGKMIQFDDHIFQMGWNHQLEDLGTSTGWNPPSCLMWFRRWLWGYLEDDRIGTQDLVGYVVHKHGEGNVGPFANGLNGLDMGVILTTY